MEWSLKNFSELTTEELYAIIKTRIDVFVVEQNCPYKELDNHDQVASHLMLSHNGKILAYARLLPKGTVYEQASIGRVLVKKEYRGRGYAKNLLKRSIDIIQGDWKEKVIRIQGQEYLRYFYNSFGFKEISGIYLDDGIPHVDMVLHQ